MALLFDSQIEVVRADMLASISASYLTSPWLGFYHWCIVNYRFISTCSDATPTRKVISGIFCRIFGFFLESFILGPARHFIVAHIAQTERDRMF